MKLLLTGIILAIRTQYVLSTLEVLLPAGKSQFCVDDQVTYRCSVPGMTYQWTVQGFFDGNRGLALAGNDPSTIIANGTSFSIVAVNIMSGTESTLSFTASVGLNGVNITCGPGSVPSDFAIVSVFGIPNVPFLNNIQQLVFNNGLSFSFDILQGGMASSCVTRYNITVSGCDQTYNTIVNATSLNDTYNTMGFGPLPVCCDQYEFSVSAVDTANRESGSVTLTQSVTLEELGSFSGEFSKSDTGGRVDIAVPPVLTSYIVDYLYSYGSESGRISDNDNNFSLVSSNMVIVVMDPCNGCSLELTPIYTLCNSTIESNSSTFMVTIMLATTDTPTTTPDTPMDGGLPMGAIIGIAVSAAVVGIVLLTIPVVVILIFICKPKQPLESKKSNIEMAKHDLKHEDNNIPTYQAPEAIKREAATTTGELYTVPEKKGNKAKGPKTIEEPPTYSIVDKGKKKDDNLVYADLDVKNPVANRSKRPPPPPGVTELDANEPVVYSSVH